MQAFYDKMPSTLEAVGNGSFKYRYAIKEVPAGQGFEEYENENRTQYECEEVTVWPPVTSNKITEAVITGKWDKNQEQKLVNEYNAAILGLYGEKDGEPAVMRIQAYVNYLEERSSLKEQVDRDCESLGIK